MSTVALPRRWLKVVRAALPEGQALPDDVWRNRHAGVVTLLWMHAVVIPVFALMQGFSLGHSVLESLIVPIAALVAVSPALARRTRTAVASLGLLTCSAVLVHLSGGVIEMHFHFFVMVAVVALYQDWVPFLAAVGYVFVHHGLFGALAPESVFNHPAARNGPWRWAAIHAFFILGISAACLVTWRLNETITAQRRKAEDRLREESRIVETLHDVGKMLAEDLDARRVVQAVTDAATSLTNAQFGAFFYNVKNDDGDAYMLFTLSGAPVGAFERFGLPRNTPIFGPTFAGDGVVRLDDVTADSRYGKMAPHYGMPQGHLPVRSYLAVPVRSRTGGVLGGLFFGHPEPARFGEVDERIVVGIAAQAAMAIDNAQLYEAERDARRLSEASRVRVAVLAEAGRVLTSSLDVADLLSQLSEVLASRVADYCVIELLDGEGTGADVSVAAVACDESVRVLRARAAERDGPSLATIRCQTSGRAELLLGPEAAAYMRDATADGEFQARIRGEGVGAVVVSPLLAHGQVLGVLLIGTSPRSGRALGVEDVAYVEEIARRTATAVENARLYSRQRTVAETLQHSLLPERLPDMPGLISAARYLPGGPDVEIGGDWYDLIPLPHGRLALAMGDVVGRGERAAALMGQLRSSARAYAFDGKSPVAIMERLNGLLLDGGPEHMATMVYGNLDLETGALRYVIAGHPPPLLADGPGDVHFLEGPSGLPIGASSTPHFEEAHVTLSPGASLVLFTDGLVEDRDTPLEIGMARFREAVCSAPDDPDDLCDHVVRRAMADRGHNDDAAILVVRLLTLDTTLHLHLAARPHVLSPLRATLRRWFKHVGADERESYELLVATMELCTNAIRHAGTSRDAHFELHADATDPLSISVRDEGRWSPPRGTVGGRGLTIAEACVDRLEVLEHDTGTEVRIERQIGAATHGAPS